MNNKKHSPVKIIISVIFILWFVTSLGLFIFLAKTGRTGLVPAAIGQYFLVFGLIIVIGGIKNKQFQPITVIFPIAGAICIAATLITYFGSENVIAFFEANLPYFLLGTLLIVGIIVVVFAFNMYFGKRKKCTLPINARCVQIKTTHDNRHTHICPVYEIYHDGKVLKICNNVYSNNFNVKVGDEKEIMINPDKPTEYYEAEESGKTALAMGIVGGVIALSIIFAFVMMAIS